MSDPITRAVEAMELAQARWMPAQGDAVWQQLEDALVALRRYEVVEGATGANPWPLGRGFIEGPAREGERPALLLVREEEP
jgi:hypothetical protein